MTTTGSSRATLGLFAALFLVAGCAAGVGAPRETAPARDSTRAPEASARSVATLQLADPTRRPQAWTLADLLQGRLAGLAVDRAAGGGIALRVRGASGKFGGEPLVVVDGDPFPGGPALSGLLQSIDPADVVRVELLKDPASTAIYGTRGANGVLLITLRHGR